MRCGQNRPMLVHTSTRGPCIDFGGVNMHVADELRRSSPATPSDRVTNISYMLHASLLRREQSNILCLRRTLNASHPRASCCRLTSGSSAQRQMHASSELLLDAAAVLRADFACLVSSYYSSIAVWIYTLPPKDWQRDAV